MLPYAIRMAPASRLENSRAFEAPTNSPNGTLNLGLLRCLVILSEELHFGRAAMLVTLDEAIASLDAPTKTAHV